MYDRSQDLPNAKIWALLVGINQYAAVNGLRGCVNDVLALKAFLTGHMCVPEAHIRVRIDREATRSAILNDFQEFLIDNPEIQIGDQILFHFSGHGSQMKDVTGEPDRWDETLVAFDSRMPDVFDIPDKTLSTLIDRLADKKGTNITIILDSCHSGSGTRELQDEGIALVRTIPADFRQPPIYLDAGLIAPQTRQAGDSDRSTRNIPYVLLAGCRDIEKSNEYWAREQGCWHGAFTFFILEYLKKIAQGSSYAELHEQVAASVNEAYPTQMPLCEGRRDRVIFGGATIQRDPFIIVDYVNGDKVILAAGLLHGLCKGTELDLYPPSVRTHNHLPDIPIATVQVTSVGPTKAEAIRTVNSGKEPIPRLAKGVISMQIHAGLKRRVALHAGKQEFDQQAIEQLRVMIQPAREHQGQIVPPGSPYLEVAAPGHPYDLKVMAERGKMRIFDKEDKLIVSPEETPTNGLADMPAVLRALESIARFERIVELKNDDPHSKLKDNIKVRFHRLVGGPESTQIQDLPQDSSSDENGLILYYDPDYPDNNLYVVEVENQSTSPVYVNIIVLNPDYSIYRLYPAIGNQDNIAANGGKLFSGIVRSGGAPLEISLPSEPWWNFSRDRIKVIATLQPIDLGLLEQDSLKLPEPDRSTVRRTDNELDRLLKSIFEGMDVRTSKPRRQISTEDWTVIDRTYTVMRRSQIPG